MIQVHSGAWEDFEPEISQVIPDVVPERQRPGSPRSESNQILLLESLILAQDERWRRA